MPTQVQPSTTSKTIQVELNAAPSLWEYEPTRTVDGYAFNGQVPGPTIEATVGDTLVIKLHNGLPEPTTIHWHGLRVPAVMDGTEVVQRPVQPGETFEYRFTLPDAGTFWYHPHVNETEQLERGLYGALVVHQPTGPVVDRERVLVLDDLKLDRKGRLARFGGMRQRHDGRRGDTLLVNGRADTELVMRAGQIERWRIVNASSSRYVLFSIGRRQFIIMGTDGGLIPAPHPTTEVLLTPGDRADLAVGPFEDGARLELLGLAYDRGMPDEQGGRYGTVRVDGTAGSRALIPDVLRDIDPLAGPAEPTTRTVVLGARLSLRGVDWQINQEAHHHAEPVRVGELQIWDIVNESKMDHPFHLHGFFFQVLSTNGVPPPFVSWEDTINVPAQGTVRIAWVADDRPGSWMYHCHILEHHAAGMMAHFEVIPSS